MGGLIQEGLSTFFVEHLIEQTVQDSERRNLGNSIGIVNFKLFFNQDVFAIIVSL